MTALAEWLERHTGRAPAALRDRVREHTRAVDAKTAPPHPLGRHPERSEGSARRPADPSVATLPQDDDGGFVTRSQASVPTALAQAAHGALEQVVAQPGDRSVALDLLAADALITLALLAEAESAPERLGDFAASLLRSERPDL